LVLDLLSQGFDRYGFKVFKADNGIDAWELFKNEHIDFVLNDIWMPGIHGKDLCYRIKSKAPDVKIAVMTGGPFNVASELIKDGIVDYFFPKPLKLIDVCEFFLAEVQSV
jgi:DNA-binding NtrC family response regulator